MPREKKRSKAERFGKARNELPPDALTESPNITEELPREVGASGAEPDPEWSGVPREGFGIEKTRKAKSSSSAKPKAKARAKSKSKKR